MTGPLIIRDSEGSHGILPGRGQGVGLFAAEMAPQSFGLLADLQPRG